MDGPALRDQEVALFIDVPRNAVYHDVKRKKVEELGVISECTANFDNTSFLYRSTHPVKGKVQKKSRVSKPSTPSEVKLELICAPFLYRAGDVFEIVNSGPLDGRWIVTDAVRNTLKDTFTTFTLEPPIAPLPEPEATEQTNSSAEAAAEGSASSVAEAAKKALAEQQAHPGLYEYSEGSNRENNGTLFGKAPRTMDCSSFATLCYKAAGKQDPSGKGYHPIGNTETMIGNMTPTSSPKPGDLAFFGSAGAPLAAGVALKTTVHVVVYIGGGKAIGMESPGVNLLEGEAKALGGGAEELLGYWTLKE
jgi:cell wall-associated NlpC family hydrolase